ncbi:MAG: AMP-binding protein [Sphaerochaetaceae bacterium]|nr:AMP-binding protein [Sphaerochaetaceae bacterium]
MKTKYNYVEEINFFSLVNTISVKYKELVALRNWKQEDSGVTYFNLAEQAKSIAFDLIKKGVKPGDRVAILGESCSMWGRAYLGIVLAGAVAVPILPNFTEDEVQKILQHSQANVIFVNSVNAVKIHSISSSLIVFRLDDLFYIPRKLKWEKNSRSFMELHGKDTKNTKLNKSDLSIINSRKRTKDDLASIIYTSGTTGQSKGVMLTHGNLIINADLSAKSYVKIKPGYRMLSILPLSHVYEFTIGFIVGLITGCEIVYLNQPPVSSALMPAMKEVKPNIMLTVPILIEKVFRRAVLPKIKSDSTLGRLYNNPITQPLVCLLIGSKLKKTFGGQLKFFGIGGAPLDIETENFLIKAHFPYAKGYGLTETSPMIAGCGPNNHRSDCVGLIMNNLEVKISDEGEVLVKGPSIMKGYYRNPELTAESFTEDGFLKTGDLGELTKGKFLALKGRCKNMILGPNGENIYPENIESIINNQEYVEESLVISNGNGELFAMIKIDIEAIAKNFTVDIEQAQTKAHEILLKIHMDSNKQLNSFSKVKKVEIHQEPFVRTPTEKIKRYLYQERHIS